MYNRIIIIIIALIIPAVVWSQDCNISVRGVIKDAGNGQPLEAVNVYLEQQSIGTISDSLGNFHLQNLCEGNYHLVFSHIGCESKRFFLEIERDTTLQIELDHSTTVLEGIVIRGKKQNNSTQNSNTLQQQKITDNAHQNLANLLENISGVSTLKNGSGISKPIVHGLYGNRLTILNNGVNQSGQQWGNDHSPEIDPLVANSIKVIKGVSALEYSGSNLGSVILVEPRKINREPHLHGSSNYFFESNGRSHGVNLQLEQFSPTLAWKINGTIKKSGDRHSADYYLNNTGNQEANIAIQLEKAFSEKLFTDAYLSSFNTELGILSGSHVGNLADLEAAFERKVPFFTSDTFSYSIDAPKQLVNHHLAKFHAKYFINNNQWLDFTLAPQLNIRKEFDVRRSGRTDIAALSLNQYSIFFETKYQQKINPQTILKSGIQHQTIFNENQAGTGILPLIPDYLQFETGVFAILNKKLDQTFLEFGVRYDNIIQNVAAISRTLPREIIRYNHTFHNFSASGGIRFEPSEHFSLGYNLGYASRNPAINELYSNGLHQGVSGIEEGNLNLQPEHSVKTTLSLKGEVQERLTFETLLYFQHINDYIFLNPQDEVRLTIRGAFPVFEYEQTNAQIYGLDFTSLYQFSSSLSLKATYSYIRGNDLTHDLPLIYMPSNNINGVIQYEIGKWKKLENLELGLTSRYVFKQNHLLPNQDFALPPNAYHLLGFQMATDVQLKSSRLRISVKVDNALNIKYRDYLNRLRYFADDMGLNAVLGIGLKF